MSKQKPQQQELTLKQQAYVEWVGELQRRHGHAHVTELASVLNVSKPSVVQMLGRLAEIGMIKRESAEVTLTMSGQRFVGELGDIQELLEDFLVGELGMGLSAARVDACRLEHVVSTVFVQNLRRYLKERKALRKPKPGERQ